MKFIISDIHGCFYTLISLLAKLEEISNEAGQSPEYIFAGDYIDRGKHNKEVIDLMISLKGDGAVCLKGNHDDVVNYIVNGRCDTILSEMMRGKFSVDNVISWWMFNGLKPTLDSYEVNCSTNFSDIHKDLVQNMPDAHKEFLNSLENMWMDDSHFACHAWMNPYEELPRHPNFLKKEQKHEIIWNRFSTGVEKGKIGLNKPVAWDKIGVFGHTPTHIYRFRSEDFSPIKQDKIRLIDTGSFLKQSICAYRPDIDDFILEPTNPLDI